MHRAILLALLAIPVLVIIHVALFWQPIPLANPLGGKTAWIGIAHGRDLRGYWRPPSLAAHLASAHTIEQGS